MKISHLRYLLSLRHAFTENGWLESARTRRSIDASGKPIPWICYSAIDFLAPRVRPEWRVCEFGSGNSTLWWADRVATVVAVEHDHAWSAIVSPKLPASVKYIVANEHDGSYERSAAGLGPFDVVVNDGTRRNECAEQIVSELAPDGVIVWDNSERAYYAGGYALLAAKGFKRIDFTGFSPVNIHPQATTVFYRPTNCLGI
jgi:hypothetical protein